MIKFNKLLKRRYLIGCIIIVFILTVFLSPETTPLAGAFPRGETLKVAVITIEDRSTTKFKNLSEKALASLYAVLTRAAQFEVIPKETVETHAKEVKIDDIEKLVEIGSLVKAECVIVGSIERIRVLKEEAISSINLQLIQTATAEVIGEARVDGTSGVKPAYKGSPEDLVKEAIYNAIKKGVDELITNYNTEGIILSTTASRARVNLGKFNNIIVGSRLGVFHNDEIVAVLQTIKVTNRESEAVIIRSLPGVKLYSGNKVRVVSIPKEAIKIVEVTEEGKVVTKKKKRFKWEPLVFGALAVGALVYFFGREKEKKKEEIVTATVDGRPISGTLSEVTPQLQVKNVRVSSTRDQAGNPVMKVEWLPLNYHYISGYHVYRAEKEINGKPATQFLKIATLPAAGCTATRCIYSDGGVAAKIKESPDSDIDINKARLTEGTIYWYQIRAFDKKGNLTRESELTPTSKAVAGEIAPPVRPEILSAVGRHREVTLTWSAPTHRIDGSPLDRTEIKSYTIAYGIYDKKTGYYGTAQYERGIPGTTSTVKNLVNHQEYWFKVKCIDTKGRESEYSSAIYATPIPSPKPSSPQWLSLKICERDDCGLQPGAGKVTLHWREVTTRVDGTPYKPTDVDQIKGYHIYRTEKRGAEFPRDFNEPFFQEKLGVEKISYTDTTVETGKSYYYCITAVNTEDEESARSAILGPVTPLKAVEKLPPPTGVTAEPGIIQIKVSWNAVPDADGYKVYSCNVNKGSCSPNILVTQITQASFIHQKLNYKNIYFYEVTTIKEGMESKRSFTVSAQPKPPIPPAAPTWPTEGDGFNPLVVEGNTIFINWKPVTTNIEGKSLEGDNTRVGRYIIYRAEARTHEEGAYGTYKEIGKVDAPKVSYEDRTPKKKDYFYFYKVKAILDYEHETIGGPLSEYRYAQVGQATLVLYTPEPGAWLLGDTTVVDEAKNLCETKWFGEGGVEYAWSPVNGTARYIIEFSYHPNMASLERNIITPAPAIQTTTTWTTGKYQCGRLIATTLWWRVKAVSDQNVALALSEVRAHTLANYHQDTIQKLPSPPTITGIPDEVTQSYVRFSFTQPTHNTDGTTMQGNELPAIYRIYKATIATGPFSYRATVLATGNGNRISYTDTAVTQGVTYYYKISTVNRAGREGPQTPNMIIAPIPEAKTPAAPGNLKVDEASDSRVKLSWERPTRYMDGTELPEGDISHYDIYRREFAATKYSKIGSSATPPFTDNTVVNGETYYYKVTVVTKGGKESSYSNEVSAIPLSTGKPPSVTQLKSYPLDGAVELTWVWPLSYGKDLKGFKRWKDGETTPDVVTTLGQCKLEGNEYRCSHTDTDVANGKTYEYKIIPVTLAAQETESEKATSTLATPISASPPHRGPQWDKVEVDPAPTRREAVKVTWTSANYRGGGGYVDLSGFKLYAADTLSNLVKAARLTETTPAANYSILDVKIKTEDGKNADTGNVTYPTDVDISEYFNTYYNGTTLIPMEVGKKYWFAVKAYRCVDLNKNKQIDKITECFYSPFSKMETAQPYSSMPPPPVRWAVNSPQALNRAVLLSWDAINMKDIPDLYGYRVRQRVGACTSPENAPIRGEPIRATEGIGGYSFVDSDLENGVTYCYWIEAVRRGPEGRPWEGERSFSAPRTARPVPSNQPNPPRWPVEQPLIASCTSEADCSVIVNWNPPAPIEGVTIAEYNVYRSDSATGHYEKVGTVQHPTQQYTNTGLWGTKTYYYRLTSVNIDGVESVFSDYRSITPWRPNIVLLSPSDGQKFIAEDREKSIVIRFSWSSVTNATNYLIEIASDRSIETLYQHDLVSQAPHTIRWQWTTPPVKNLPPTLYWRVTAYMQDGTTIISEVRSFNIAAGVP